MNNSRYYVSREDGTVTGPHHPAAIRREVDAGELNLDTLVALEGTQDWLPIIDWGTDIIPAPPKPSVAHYVAAMPVNQQQKSSVRMVWAWFAIISGVAGVGMGSLFLTRNFTAIPLFAIGMGFLWAIAGAGELIRQSRKS